MWRRIPWEQVVGVLFGVILIGLFLGGTFWVLRSDWKEQHDPCESFIGRPISQVPERCVHPKPPEPIYSAVPVPQ